MTKTNDPVNYDGITTSGYLDSEPLEGLDAERYAQSIITASSGDDYYGYGYEIEVDSNKIEIFGTEEQRISMFVALSKYFEEIENPENTVVNTFFKAKYSPLNKVLNTIRPILGRYGFSIIQVPTFDGTNCAVNTILTHSGGATISFPALKNKPTKADVQGMGSTLTYLRRFSLNAIAGVMGEVDDDGNAASTKGEKKEPKATQKPTNSPEKEALISLCKKKIAEAKSANKETEARNEINGILKKYEPKKGSIAEMTDKNAELASAEIKKVTI